MELIEGVALSELCDYSFGDQSGKWGNIYTSFMKDASLLNTEFASKAFEIRKKRDWMTLFIDNIRLYKRPIADVKPEDKPYIDSLMDRNDLLWLCNHYEGLKFIIFTNLEDTPIDGFIHGLIPQNVLCISAVNAIANGGKVVPAPYGVQRRMSRLDTRIEQLQNAMDNDLDPVLPLPFKAITLDSLFKYNNEKTSPPIPVDIGSTTFKTAAAAIAASTALPPFFKISKPALAAKGWLVAIDPFDPNTSERLELYLLNLKVLISYFDLGLNISVNASPSKFQQKIKIHTTATGARICSG